MPESNREEIAKLEALYANNPGGRVFTHLAEAYRRTGDLDKARTILEDGIGRYPDYASAHVVLGRVLQDQGHIHSATVSFRRVLELDPENRVALRSLGDLARLSGRRQEALDHYRHLKSLDPTDEELHALVEDLSQPAEDDTADLIDTTPLPLLEDPVETAVSDAVDEPAFSETAGSAPELPEAKAVTPDFALDWGTDEEEEGLPGDLAHLAAASTAGDLSLPGPEPEAPADAEPEPEMPAVPETVFDLESTFPIEPAFEPTLQDVEPLATEPAFQQPQVDEPAAVTEPIDLEPAEFSVDPAALDEREPESEPEPLAFEPLLPGSEEPPIEPIPMPLPQIELTEAPEAEPSDEEFEPVPPIAAEAEIEPVAEMPPEPASMEAAAPEPEPSFESMLSTSRGGLTPLAAAEPEVELPTETLGDLYRRQGFNDRAAEVYRTLLQQRPDDEQLEAKLREVEGAVAEPAAPAAGQTEPERADEAPPSAWIEGPGAAAGAPTPYAWHEEAAEEEASGPNLGEYLRALLAWRPESTPPLADLQTGSVLDHEDDQIVILDQVETVSFMDTEPPLGEDPGALEPWASGELEPWETEEPGGAAAPSAGAAVPPQQPTPKNISGNPVEDAFEEWFSSDEPTPQSARAQPEAPAAAAPAGQAPAEAVPGEDDSDDDLEMFRSWLQSLKK